jgi:purine nucleoside phosphorylase
MPAPVAVILGSAFAEGAAAFGSDVDVEPQEVETRFGRQLLYRVEAEGRPAYLLFRHGVPHRLLPHQINYRAQAAALAEVGCGALLVTSSVGVMDEALPLYRPLLVGDLLTMDNRLPDGSACTLFPEERAGHGHLVLSEGLFSEALTRQVARLAEAAEAPPAGERVVFGYVGGPRGKTAAENRMWRRLGAQVNSMTLAPEVILANELEIPCAALVVGHKYSIPDMDNPEDEGSVAATLDDSREALRRAIRIFAEQGEAVPFGNHLFRFDEAPTPP